MDAAETRPDVCDACGERLTHGETGYLCAGCGVRHHRCADGGADDCLDRQVAFYAALDRLGWRRR